MTRPDTLGAHPSRPNRRRHLALIGSVLCAIALNALAARMYQWTDPQTGTTQLAGRPPPWFRTGEPGPRVRVFERGKIVDDTAYPAAPPPTGPPPAAITQDAPAAPEASDRAAAAAGPATADPRAEFKALLEAWDREQATRALQTRPATGLSTAPPPPAQ